MRRAMQILLASFSGNTLLTSALNLRLQFSKSKYFLGFKTAVNADNHWGY